MEFGVGKYCMMEVRSQNYPLEVMNTKALLSSKHRHSKSDSEKRVKEHVPDSSPKCLQNLKLDVGKAKGHNDSRKYPAPGTLVQSSLKQEILQLEKRLKDQMVVRLGLEEALGYRSSALDSSNDSSMPKSTKELIREIAVLELEVMHLEQYLLALYRKAFDQQVSTSSPTAVGDKSRRPLSSHSGIFQEVSCCDLSSDKKNPVSRLNRMSMPQKSAARPVDEACHQKLTDHGVARCWSALSQRGVCSDRISPSEESLARALQACHSQPLNFLQEGENTTSGVISLAEYLGTSIADHIPETPNSLSEDMVRCMGAIYCKLTDSSLVHHGLPTSPTSSFSSTSAFSPQYFGDMWSPSCKKESTLDSRLINPFRVEGIKEFSGPYNAMVEVPFICKETRRLSEVEHMLQNFKTLVYRLGTVDPRKLKNEEKLAFWINIHNALLMNAYLVYGFRQHNLTKASLLVKAKCVIGGHSINAEMIQSSILGCRTHCPGQWFRTFLSPKMKWKSGDEWKAYAIQHPEPLLHFALCSGSHSDPAVRIYTPKRLFQQLETAKEEYIRATVGIRKEQKILLPKLIESYAKVMGLSSQEVVDMMHRYLPETLRIAMQRCQQLRSHKIIEWIPHNFTFRYLLSRDLANSQIR